ncbi:hypothetical protein QBC47DRAFT_363008 [Echria macrotheca]|uniref:Uncharacterized protein n=1 Tax=Echria macrotheca TaxID=438768 RepID=A0AAJ0B7L8_9PEZI|nr:hypothetical protein QBC47DRAFT_363008 [Echria macrotheca]
MCLYDYTPYIGCSDGEQHFYLQWMKCNKAADRNEYCPLDKSVPVEELRDFSGNVLCCPMHRHIVVQQHQFVFLQAGSGQTPNLIDLDDTPKIGRDNKQEEAPIRTVEIEYPVVEQTLQSPRLSLAPKSPRVIREERPVSPEDDVNEQQQYGEETSPGTDCISPTSSMDVEPPTAPGFRPKSAARGTATNGDAQGHKRSSTSQVPSHRRTNSSGSSRAHRRTGSLQETWTSKGKGVELAPRASLRSPPQVFDDPSVPEDAGIGLPARPDIHRRPSVASKSSNEGKTKAEYYQPRHPDEGPSVELPEIPASSKRLPPLPVGDNMTTAASTSKTGNHRRESALPPEHYYQHDDDERGRRSGHRRARSDLSDQSIPTTTAEPRHRRQSDQPPTRPSQRARSHSSDRHYRARSRSESADRNGAAYRNIIPPSRPSAENSRSSIRQQMTQSSSGERGGKGARAVLATQTHWNDELTRRNTDNRGYVHQVPPSRKWHSPTIPDPDADADVDVETQQQQQQQHDQYQPSTGGGGGGGVVGHHYPLAVSKLSPRPLPDAAYLPLPVPEGEKGLRGKGSLGRLRRTLEGFLKAGERGDGGGRKAQGASL